MRRLAITLSALSAIFIFSCSALAQSAGTIQGVITDNSGGVIPGAQVVVSNIETGMQSTGLTNKIGFYRHPALNPGRYTVAISMQGFAPAERRDLRLEVAQTMRVDFRLTLGTVTEIVEVS